MTIYYVDDGGSGTAPYDTWAKAAPNLKALDAAVAFASNDIVYVGHDSAETATHTGNATVVCATAAPACQIISATSGSDPVAYQAASATQVNTSAGAYWLRFDGAVALAGLKLESGGTMSLYPDSNEDFSAQDCTFVLPANGVMNFDCAASNNGARFLVKDCVVDLTADGSTERTAAAVGLSAKMYVNGLSFVNAAYRSYAVLAATPSYFHEAEFVNVDFSGFTFATPPGLVSTYVAGPVIVRNSKTAATWTPYDDTYGWYPSARLYFYNVGPANAPTYLLEADAYGSVTSTASIYRTDGATVGATPWAWLMTGSTLAKETSPFYSPWIIGAVAATGSTTFSIYIANDTADFTDAEVWLEVECLETAGEPGTPIASGRRATLTTTPANHTDDAVSVWNGTGPSFTYMQKLECHSNGGDCRTIPCPCCCRHDCGQ